MAPSALDQIFTWGVTDWFTSSGLALGYDQEPGSQAIQLREVDGH